MPGNTLTPPLPHDGAQRLTQPETANDLLMYRLNRLLATAGSLVVRLCEGGYGITRREWGLLMVLAQQPQMPPAELARRRAGGLTPRQDELLQRWGYPFVLEEFRFHMSLTGPLSGVHADTQTLAAWILKGAR